MLLFELVQFWTCPEEGGGKTGKSGEREGSEEEGN